MATIASEVPAKADPTLFGVEVPLTITLDAAKSVADAWKTCFVALSAALKDKLAKKDAPAAETPAPSETPVASA